jgi:hypothetical protein
LKKKGGNVYDSMLLASAISGCHVKLVKLTHARLLLQFVVHNVKELELLLMHNRKYAAGTSLSH